MNEFIPHISSLLDGIFSGLSRLVPELILIATFVISIFSGLFISRRWPGATLLITLGGIILSAIASISLFNSTGSSAGGEDLLMGLVVSDRIGLFTRLLIAAVCMLFCVFVHYHTAFRVHKKKNDDLYSILLAVQLGLNLMVISINWLMAFIAIEMVSVGSYILVGYLAKEARQTEAAMKYALFGSVCSAVMLYGLSLIYGFTGSLDFTSEAHLASLMKTEPALLLLAMLFVFTGLGFKLSFVPFHFWSPDVYQGAPTPVTAFLSTAPKIAAIVLLSRFLFAWPAAGIAFPDQLLWLLMLAAIGTMLLGNLAALRQQNVKRMMAYSSIGHTGFLLMTILAYPENAYQVVLFYLVIYAITNIAVFMLADYLEERTGATELEDYRGLGKVYNFPLLCFVVAVISLTGLPPTAGFTAKLMAFSAVYANWQSLGHPGMLLMLITGALTTVISLFYYFKIPLNAFLRERKEDAPDLLPDKPGIVVLWLVALLSAAVILFGLFPQWLLQAFN